jgi:GWxTD domain-containing protein
MRCRTATSLHALVLLFAATPCLAALDKYKDWEKSPESDYLATDDEKKEWKKIASDEDAEKFIALFWARRDPDLKTPTNEFRERFDALVKKADELFPLGRKRGALTERGRALVLIGPPKSTADRVMLSPRQELLEDPQQAPSAAANDSSLKTVFPQWLYEKPQLPAWADIPSLEIPQLKEVPTY